MIEENAGVVLVVKGYTSSIWRSWLRKKRNTLKSPRYWKTRFCL